MLTQDIVNHCCHSRYLELSLVCGVVHCPFCVEWTLITNRKDGGCPGGGCDETPTASNIILINLCEFMISFQSMDPFDKFIFVFLLYGIILIIIGTILFTVEFTDVCPATRHVRGSSQSCL